MPKKVLKGVIKSITGPKTIGVEVVRTFHHPQYRKRVRRAKRYLARFEGEAAVGMNVVIQETVPISKKKRWTVIELEGNPVTQKTESPVEKKAEKTAEPKKKTAKKTGGAKK